MTSRRRTRVALLGALLLAAGAASAGDGWRSVTGPPELELPRDHGAHPDYRTEWWYLTGLVADGAGRRFGFQITFFRQGLAPGDPPPGSSALRARQVVAAHLAVSDLEGDRLHHAERVRRTGGGLAGWSETDLDVWLEGWEMRRRDDGVVAVVAHDPETGIGLELALEPTRPPVLHGDAGYSRKGPDPGNASAYVSWTRLATSGEIELAGDRFEVDGTAWFDHEWGTSQLGEGVVGWDWFSLRLDDGRDLMVYRLRRDDGSWSPYSSGTLVETDGRVVHLGHSDVGLEPVEWWTSPDTGGRYPTAWRLELPDHGIDLELRALLPASELDGRATTGVVYWEGPVAAAGSQRGEGYAELTGYAGSLAERF